ncbi:MAG TPA: radical SAM family heme chaperone HemW [Aliidongia sp.]|nr:radical SAM family heme chaperone HemW [Aliidongia sp.]
MTGPVTATAPGFAIYVHWPFCLSKCPYCDFNSHVRERIEQDRWRTALLAELDHYARLTPGRTVTSIFFGGGTPSLMEPATVGAVIDRIAARWTLDPAVEITLEANPTSVEAGRFQGFRSAGVNRVSLGIQALDQPSLTFLGRQHSAEEALGAIDLAARHFDRYSFDLIYARPNQTLESWAAELDRALDLAAGHLSVYQLTIEQGTAFATAHARGDFILPDDELAGALYELTQARLAAAGMPSYEISNHARPGQASRHNLTYWRYGDYVGVGPGAHGRLTLGGDKIATRQAKAPETWLARVEAQGHGTQETETIDPAARAEELVMMGLRLAEGIPRQRFRDELGLEPEDLVDATALGHLTEGGFVTLDRDRLAATDAGRQRLNAVLAALLR